MRALVTGGGEVIGSDLVDRLLLLMIQAVRELEAENDDLTKQIGEIDELKKRISDLERLFKEFQQRPSAQRQTNEPWITRTECRQSPALRADERH